MAEAHANLGTLYTKLKEPPPSAERSFAHALALQPTRAEFHRGHADALLQAGKLQPGIASFRQALSLRPAYADASAGLAEALKRAGRPAEAEAEYIAMVVSGGGSLPAEAAHLTNFGVLLLQKGDAPSSQIAERLMRTALRLDPTQAVALSLGRPTLRQLFSALGRCAARLCCTLARCGSHRRLRCSTIIWPTSITTWASQATRAASRSRWTGTQKRSRTRRRTWPRSTISAMR